jgi:hypothetical protein
MLWAWYVFESVLLCRGSLLTISLDIGICFSLPHRSFASDSNKMNGR